MFEFFVCIQNIPLLSMWEYCNIIMLHKLDNSQYHSAPLHRKLQTYI